LILASTLIVWVLPETLQVLAATVLDSTLATPAPA
jgi:hypothetical protein